MHLGNAKQSLTFQSREGQVMLSPTLTSLLTEPPTDNYLCNYCTDNEGAKSMIRVAMYGVMQSFAEQRILDIVKVHLMDISISGVIVKEYILKFNDKYLIYSYSRNEG